MNQSRDRIFVSYSRRDVKYLEELKLHLGLLEKTSPFSWWADTRITPGSRWREEIREAVDRARVAVLLISPHFLASDFVAENELPPLLHAAERDNALILPVIASPCLFSRVRQLSRYQAINPPERTLEEMGDAERARTWVRLGETIVDVLLNGELVLQQPRVAVSELPAGNSTSEPQLVLRVTSERLEQKLALVFQLSATHASLRLSERMFGPVILDREPLSYLRDIERTIYSFTHRRSELRIAQQRLEAMGSFLLESLLPHELCDMLVALQEKVSTLHIVSDELWIPWEMLRLRTRVAGRWTPGEFLCEAFDVTRGSQARATTLRLPLKRIAVVAPRDSELRALDSEVRFLESKVSERREVVRLSASFLPLVEALASGLYDGWHFVVHSIASGDDHARVRIVLEQGQDLRPEDLSGSAANLGASKPLIFLGGSYINGWAQSFSNAGAGAVIGSYWVTTDDAATAFARFFYEEFFAGTPLAAAIRSARLSTRDANPGDPSWLTFTCIGDPFARCEEPDLESRAQPTAPTDSA